MAKHKAQQYENGTYCHALIARHLSILPHLH
jgi:hypothetical protein